MWLIFSSGLMAWMSSRVLHSGHLLTVTPGVGGGCCFAVFEARRLRLDKLAPQCAGKGEKVKKGMLSHSGSVYLLSREFRGPILFYLYEPTKGFVKEVCTGQGTNTSGAKVSA